MAKFSYDDVVRFFDAPNKKKGLIMWTEHMNKLAEKSAKSSYSNKLGSLRPVAELPIN